MDSQIESEEHEEQRMKQLVKQLMGEVMKQLVKQVKQRRLIDKQRPLIERMHYLEDKRDRWRIERYAMQPAPASAP